MRPFINKIIKDGHILHHKKTSVNHKNFVTTGRSSDGPLQLAKHLFGNEDGDVRGYTDGDRVGGA